MRFTSVPLLALLTATVGCAELEGDDPFVEPVESAESAIGTGNCTILPPVIGGVTYAAASTNGKVLVKPPTSPASSPENIVYLKGNYLDVVIKTQRCATVTGVDGYADTASVPPILTGWVQHARVLKVEDFPNIINSLDHRKITVRIHNPNTTEGDTSRVVVRLQGATAQSKSSHAFYLSEVADVGQPLVYSMSSGLLRNNYIASTFKTFGDDGRTEDAELKRFKNPDYGSLDVSVKTDGVAFKDVRTLIVDNFCDFEVTTKGRFKLKVIPPQSSSLPPTLGLDWLSGPSLSFDADGACGVFGVDGLINLVVSVWSPADDIKEDVAKSIGGSLPQTCVIDCLNFVTGFEHRDNELAIFIDHDQLGGTSDSDSVTVNVPYDAEGASWLFEGRGGLMLQPGQSVFTTVSGVARLCKEDDKDVAGGCTLIPVTGNGLVEKFDHKSGPVPTPWPDTPSGPAYIARRHQAWNALVGPLRKANTILSPTVDVGVLLARKSYINQGSQNVLRLQNPCSTTAGGTLPSQLAFGANDVVGKDEGTGSYRVTLRFADDVLPCQAINQF